MNWRIFLALVLVFCIGCSSNDPTPDYWLQWCADELLEENVDKNGDLQRLRESFVYACNSSLSAQMGLNLNDFSKLDPPCGFHIKGDTLVWQAFFQDSKLNQTLSPDFRSLGADSAKHISNYEACFYRTMDMCFEALRIVRIQDTVDIPLPFLLQ
jgi:hypothetical protein